MIDDDLQDERLNTIEETVNENSNDIDGTYFSKAVNTGFDYVLVLA